MRPERLGLGNKGYNKRACLALLLAKNSFYLLSVYVECSDDFVFTAFADNRCLYCDLDCLVFFRQKYNKPPTNRCQRVIVGRSRRRYYCFSVLLGKPAACRSVSFAIIPPTQKPFATLDGEVNKKWRPAIKPSTDISENQISKFHLLSIVTNLESEAVFKVENLNN